MKLRLVLVLLALLAFGIPLLVWPQLDSKFRKGTGVGDAHGGLQNHGDEGNCSPKRTFKEHLKYQRTFREFHHATIADFCFHPFARTFSEPTPEDFRDDNASEATTDATTDAPLEALADSEPKSAPKKQMRGPSVPNRHGIEHQIKLFGHIRAL